MEDYVKEAETVKNTNESLRRAYDHESVMMQDSFEEGIAEGIVKGQRNKEIELVKKMFAEGLDIDFIKKFVSLTKKEILALK